MQDLINKITHGDCLEVMKTIADKSIDMVCCDLPYGTTACKWDTIIPFEPLWEQYKRIIKDNGAIVLTASQPFTTDLINSNRKYFKYTMVYKKRPTGHLLSKKRPLQGFEDICIFYKKQPIYNPQMIKRTEKELKRLGTMNCLAKDKKIETERGYNIKTKKRESYDYKFPNTIIENVGQQLRNIKHPTQKPVALFEYLIKTYTNEGDLVLDNCSGSGTTAIACLGTNRKYICIEKDEVYYQKSLARVEEYNKQLKLF